MFSIIICSIKESLLEQLKRNIDKTIGCEYEILAYNNMQDKQPLAKIYNRGIADAVYPYLVFVHEDVIFKTKGWGKILLEKLTEADCGIVGFAGSKVKFDIPSGWDQGNKYNVWHFYDHDRLADFNISGAYTPVAVLDGFFMAVRTDVARENMFDECCLSGFHCYDIDFSLAVLKNFRNYVCSNIDAAHFSSGSYNRAWYDLTMAVYYKKWKRFLPVSTDGTVFSSKDTEYAAYLFLFRILRIKELPLFKKKQQFHCFVFGFKFTSRHIKHCLQCGIKLLREILRQNHEEG